MKTVYLFFAARRYWPDCTVLNQAYEELAATIAAGAEHHLFLDTDPIPFPKGDCLIVIPMSGAVQKYILAAAANYDSCILYGAYIRGNASEEITERMLYANAAPTLMDTWAVLHRTTPRTRLALNRQQLIDVLAVFAAYYHMKGAKVLKIGETEPWVISNASSTDCYEKRFGVTIIPVSQQELVDLYTAASDENAAKYYQFFTQNSCGCREPVEKDLSSASRMAYALVALLEKYHAKAAAIACFNLLKTGTNTCLGVSYVNDCTDCVVSCECDMDSAITMLFMKTLTKDTLWMANPGLQPDGTINFSHCTGPVHCHGHLCPTILRSHHESGIGVSLQIDYPIGSEITAVRISDEASKITVHKAISIEGPYEPCCRTQVHMKMDDMDHYLRTALGCHQVFAFEDITVQVRSLAELFGLEIL